MRHELNQVNMLHLWEENTPREGVTDHAIVIRQKTMRYVTPSESSLPSARLHPVPSLLHLSPNASLLQRPNTGFGLLWGESRRAESHMRKQPLPFSITLSSPSWGQTIRLLPSPFPLIPSVPSLLHPPDPSYFGSWVLLCMYLYIHRIGQSDEQLGSHRFFLISSFHER